MSPSVLNSPSPLDWSLQLLNKMFFFCLPSWWKLGAIQRDNINIPNLWDGYNFCAALTEQKFIVRGRISRKTVATKWQKIKLKAAVLRLRCVTGWQATRLLGSGGLWSEVFSLLSMGRGLTWKKLLFFPLSEMERQWTNVRSYFVGRDVWKI